MTLLAFLSASSASRSVCFLLPPPLGLLPLLGPLPTFPAGGAGRASPHSLHTSRVTKLLRPHGQIHSACWPFAFGFAPAEVARAFGSAAARLGARHSGLVHLRRQPPLVLLQEPHDHDGGAVPCVPAMRLGNWDP